MQRWKLSALAAATFALSGFTSSDAWALALGRITVQSALGEPLRAEVEIPQLTTAEAESLQAAIASPATFRAQGMEYTGLANSVRIKVQKRANGTAVLQLSSFQPVNDPFVDLVIDANWASGKLQRNYTLLLDPPASRRPAPTVTAAAQASAPEVVRPRPIPPLAVERPVTSPVAGTTASRDLRNNRDTEDSSAKPQRKRTAPAAASAERADSSGDSVKTKVGDTAGRLAAAHRPAGVSLDQMLVAIVRGNPQAFVNGNVNRMRSGAVLNVPDAEAAKATSQREARQILATQSRDFNEFRRQLAGAAPAAPVEAATRAASGQVQAHVQDAKPSTAAPDKLTLSKGAVKAAAADEKLAQQKQSADQSSRVDELKRNMAEMGQIAAATKPEGTSASANTGTNAAAGAAAGIAVPSATATANSAAAPAVAAAPVVPAAAEKPSAAVDPLAPTATENAATPAPETAGTATSAEAGSDATQPAAAETVAEVTPAPTPKPAPVVAPAPAPEEPSFIDSLMEDPTIPLAGAALLALLLGYGGYRVAQRRKAAAAVADSTLGDSQLGADSFFGASGGQRVDTGATTQMSGHSMQYSPSQLDAGDVDPLAEADVYLAYGRDLQAEEILKEALRSSPTRLVLHQKLGEIYAKRHDRLAFESTANNVFALTQGQGIEWQRISDQGRILDPENALYQPGGSPQERSSTEAASTSLGGLAPAAAVGAVGFGQALASVNQTFKQSSQPSYDDREGPSTVPVSMDLDMDLDLPGGLADSHTHTQQLHTNAHIPQPSAQDFDALELNSPVQAPSFQPPAASMPDSTATVDNGLNMDFADLGAFTSAAPTAEPAKASDAFESTSLSALEFDLDSFITPQASASLDTTEDNSTEPLPLNPQQDHKVADGNVMEFDINSLSLDLGGSPTSSSTAAALAAVTAAPTTPDDPLSTKLALAEEFNVIGDTDGARTLIEEVIAEAHGDLRTKAQNLLSQIG